MKTGAKSAPTAAASTTPQSKSAPEALKKPAVPAKGPDKPAAQESPASVLKSAPKASASPVRKAVPEPVQPEPIETIEAVEDFDDDDLLDLDSEADDSMSSTNFDWYESARKRFSVSLKRGAPAAEQSDRTEPRSDTDEDPVEI